MLLTFLALQLAMGACLGVIVAASLLLLDVGGITGLIKQSAEPWLPMAMLYVACALTFASVKTGVAVMRLAYPADGPQEYLSDDDDRPANEG